MLSSGSAYSMYSTYDQSSRLSISDVSPSRSSDLSMHRIQEKKYDYDYHYHCATASIDFRVTADTARS
jgi:hypothetical protein